MLDVVSKQSQIGTSRAHKFQLYAMSLWQGTCQFKWRASAGQFVTFCADSASFSKSVGWLLIFCLSIFVFFQNLNRHTMRIESIAVPKQLQENGFTGEVAAQRLCDAINEFMSQKNKKTSMKTPDVRLQRDEPAAVVPATGFSFEAVVAALPRLVHADDRRILSGDLTVTGAGAGAKVWLRLRLNGTAFYNSEQGTSLDEVDQLFKTAAPKVVWMLAPYLVASQTYFSSDPDKALDMAKQIIAERQPPDENVSRAYNLKALIYLEQKNYAFATDAVETAMKLAPNLGVVHNTKALIFFGREKYDEAKEEFEKAVKNDPKDVRAHINLGIDLHRLGEDDAAIVEYDLALNIDSNNAKAAHNRADALHALHRDAEAIVQYQAAIKFDPTDTIAKGILADLLRAAGRLDELATLDPRKPAAATRDNVASNAGNAATAKAPIAESGSLPIIASEPDKDQAYSKPGRYD